MARAPIVEEIPTEEPMESENPSGRVLATITQNEDGSYGLQAGDEGGEMPAEPMSYGSIGELMGAILDILEGNQPGDEQAAMSEAFGDQAAPSKGGPAY